MPTLIFRKSALRPCEASISAIKRDEHAHPLHHPIPANGSFRSAIAAVRSIRPPVADNPPSADRSRRQRARCDTRSPPALPPAAAAGGIQAVGEHLRASNRSLLHVEEQIHAAPDEALIKQMAERRRLAEIPFPTALFGELRGKIGQPGNTSGEMISGSAVSP